MTDTPPPHQSNEMSSWNETKRDARTVDDGEGVEDDDALGLLRREQNPPPHRPATRSLLQHALLPIFLLGLPRHRHLHTGAGTVYRGAAWRRVDPRLAHGHAQAWRRDRQ
jgi:hypothetical protein